MKSSWRNFLACFIFPSLLAFAAMLPNDILFSRSGEREFGPTVAQNLVSDSDCIYGRATTLGLEPEDFKFRQYELIGADVVAVGSSRSMQFRQDYFTARFFTFGGVVGNLKDMEETVEKLLAIHRPKYVILQLDYWWFNGGYLRGIIPKPHSVLDHLLRNLRLPFDPFFWLADRRILLDQYWALLRRGRLRNDTCRIGLRAHLQDEGYGSDGSYFYGDNYLKRRKTSYFHKEYQEIDAGNFRSGGARGQISGARVEILMRILGRLDSSSVPYVITFPPIAPSVLGYMKQRRPEMLSFMNEVADTVAQLAPQTYDFHDGRRISVGDCEFVDGDHAGQIAYAKLLGGLKDVRLLELLDTARISDDIDAYSGRSVAARTLQRYMPGSREADFLGIGCDKEDARPDGAGQISVGH